MRLSIAVGIAVLAATLPACGGRGGFELSKNPMMYDMAFTDVVTTSLVKTASGTDYISVLGERYRDPKMSVGHHVPCRVDEVPVALLGEANICQVAAPASGDNCQNRDGCGALRFDPPLLRRADIRAQIAAALSAPCKQLREPSTLETVAGARLPGPLRLANIRGRGLAYSAREDWDKFGCGTRRSVTATNIRFDEASGVVTFRF